MLAAAAGGRNSIGYEIDPVYLTYAAKRIREQLSGLFARSSLTVNLPGHHG